jgi:putative tryptophan/tyrosine transport system substrate-binding protein
MSIRGMKRRAFIAAFGGAAVWPLVARAQQPGRIYRIGILTTDYPGDRANSVIFRFVPALARLGYIEGRNLEILWRGVAGDVSKLPMLAQELIGAQVELIVAAGLPSIKAARESTSRIPIVMGYTGDDPVAAGLVATLNRPGGNVTGVSFLGSQADAKRFELLAEAFGQLKHLGQLTDPVFSADRLQLVQHVATAMGVELTFIRAANRDDYDKAFARGVLGSRRWRSLQTQSTTAIASTSPIEHSLPGYQLSVRCARWLRPVASYHMGRTTTFSSVGSLTMWCAS